MSNAKLYFAYGANTSIESMASRCPSAVPVGVAVLHGHALTFKGVADVVPREGASVMGALWELTPECEKALDLFEGFPHLYRKAWVTYEEPFCEPRQLMYYTMNSNKLSTPSQYYEDLLREGYADFGMDPEQLELAIAEAAQAEFVRETEARRKDKAKLKKWQSRLDKKWQSRPLMLGLVPGDGRYATGAGRAEHERDEYKEYARRLSEGFAYEDGVESGW